MRTLTVPHQFLTMYICDVLLCKPNETFIEQFEKMFESRMSVGATGKLPGCEKLQAQIVPWFYETEGHVHKCVERYCELANKQVEHFFSIFFFKFLLGSKQQVDHQFKQEDLESVAELSEACSQIVFKCMIRGTNWTT